MIIKVMKILIIK